MPNDPRFQFGSIAIDLTACTPQNHSVVMQGGCVPPSCGGNSLCMPGGRTYAMVRYRDLPNPAADLNRLLGVLAELQMSVQILAARDEMEAIERAVRSSS